MNVKVLYLGPARDWAGCETETFELPREAPLERLIDELMKRRPELARARRSIRFAVNDDYANESVTLAEGDTVAVIPPVSGGCETDLISLTEQPIDTTAVRRHLDGDTGAGGLVVFEGVVRREESPAHGNLLQLDYESHTEMAEKQMRELAGAARERWPIQRLAVVHRLGPVDLGETSVIIAVACVHREEAFAACRWLIDELKKNVLIWKREVWEDGDQTWSEPTRYGA